MELLKELSLVPSLPQTVEFVVAPFDRSYAYVSIRQHTSAYVSIRQHTLAYVSICMLTVEFVVVLFDRSYADVC